MAFHSFTAIDSKGVEHNWRVEPFLGSKQWRAIQLLLQLGVGEVLLKGLAAAADIKNKKGGDNKSKITIDDLKDVDGGGMLNIIISKLNNDDKSLDAIVRFFLVGSIRDKTEITKNNFDTIFQNNITESLIALEEVFSVNTFLQDLVTYVLQRLSKLTPENNTGESPENLEQ